jgi:regulatory protein
MPDYNEIITRAKHFCAYQERCIADVRKKLLVLNASPAQADKAVKELLAEGYINEDRFAGIFAAGKFRNNQWGKIRIRLELKQRKIHKKSIQKALESITQEEYRTKLKQIITRKLEEYNEPNPVIKKQKIITYAIGKGFETDEIYKALEELS